MLEWVEAFGAFFRWVFKGFKTSLRDEVSGNFKKSWGPSYDIENLIIGYAASIIILAIVYWFFLR
jgi:hypothetical protein